MSPADLRDRLAERSVLQELAAEPLLGLGAGRALLLQLAEPGVAQGVADHSDFQRRPLARLFGTLDFLLIVTFGEPDEVERMAARVRGLHNRVTGPGYSGNDADLQVWVNATLIDAALYVYREVMRPGDDERDLSADYYREARIVAEVLGCPPDAQPPDLAAFEAYMAEKIATLEVGDAARQVARAVLWPGRLWYLAPAIALFRLLTIAMLPEPVRAQYGFEWSHGRQRAADLFLRLATDLYHVTPAFLRRPPRRLLVRLAERRVQATFRSRRARRR
ncbi:oxygenase MpaB family protein [Actinomadura macrotermitis]|uniref:ER-bound oxygenase mpaB/mpaB'/Rubber oxygenase catalytic domain-containing protein n=1 Tax=Actinomadura macrotermitis TaxID=2585200 RepID=A0A7K0C2W7_9ACTN|nr:oxygenase MpaB family protein [Actinomadura macrotermitis]MQY07775.1 hypothetical protein [Actinomadura macrotermitis]